jgi:hypothetical protein
VSDSANLVIGTEFRSIQCSDATSSVGATSPRCFHKNDQNSARRRSSLSGLDLPAVTSAGVIVTSASTIDLRDFAAAPGHFIST